MNYCIYKLKFKTPVHFGKGRLTNSAYTVYADTLFSALYKEAVLIYGEEKAKKLYEYCINDELKLSDTMPYRDDILYIPKPILALNVEKQGQGNSKLKKKFKGLAYIPIGDVQKFVKGEYEPKDDENKFGEHSVRYGVKVKNDDDNEPFSIDTYTFFENCGLYFIVAYSNSTVIDMFEEIMESLSYTGIGGKLSTGFGKFEYTYSDSVIDSGAIKMLDGNFEKYMSLSISMAEDDELENCLDGATFELVKRSGFVSSSKYSEEPLKKNDFYSFKGGSCFNCKFKGSIFDVSDTGKGHSVYRYAIPMFIGIK